MSLSAVHSSRETPDVLAVVQQFFDALHTKSADGLRATCQPGAQFTAGRPGADGTYLLRQRPVETDIEHLSNLSETWLERMWSPTVHVHGRIAMVWTRYDFHRNGKFSHNGTDCFTLMQTDTGWRIVCAAFSVEPEGRSEHPGGSPT